MNFNVKCGFTGCSYTTGDLPESLANSALNSHAQSHIATHRDQEGTNSQDKSEKVQRPILPMACTSEDWDYWFCEWENYKITSGMKDTNIVAQLMACGEETLRRNIYRTHGNMVGKTDIKVLEMMRKNSALKEQRWQPKPNQCVNSLIIKF